MQTVNALLLSDTHGRLHPGILQVADGVDVIVHAGDVGHPDVISQLASCGARLVAVRGNNDLGKGLPARERQRLTGLPEADHLQLPGGTLSVEHGHRVNPAARRHGLLRDRHPMSRLVVYGHSHRLCIDTSDTPWVANPGAAGRSRTFGGPSCLLLTATPGEWSLQELRFSLQDW